MQVSYEGSTAEAYLLGYVPPYIHQARRFSGAPFPLLIFQAGMSFGSAFSFLAQVLS